jgi:hypothetical protein
MKNRMEEDIKMDLREPDVRNEEETQWNVPAENIITCY